MGNCCGGGSLTPDERANVSCCLLTQRSCGEDAVHPPHFLCCCVDVVVDLACNEQQAKERDRSRALDAKMAQENTIEQQVSLSVGHVQFVPSSDL